MLHKKSRYSVGLMTGTVLDGNIDVALLKSNGEVVYEFGPYSLDPYDEGVVDLLQQTLAAAQEWQFNGPEPDLFAKAEQLITEQQSNAVLNVLQHAGIYTSQISVVGFHGQSVLHKAPVNGLPGRTRQLGNGQLMANMLNVPVAWDFRSRDVAAGGQGAPLAPVYHQALLRLAQDERKLQHGAAVLNLGGVGNITWWDGGNELVAFDTGPANAPVNDWVARFSSSRMDTNGAYAANGVVDEVRLAQLLEHPYITAKPPKSLDRNDFSAAMAEGKNLEDGAALLTAFSAAAVAKAINVLPRRPNALVLCGGGRHNPTMVAAIEHYTGLPTVNADHIGWRGDAVEAECFAFLAERVMRKLPLSFPSTTGVSAPMFGGKLSYPTN